MEKRNAKIATAAHASLYGALTVLFIILTVVNYGRKDFLSGLAAAFICMRVPLCLTLYVSYV